MWRMENSVKNRTQIVLADDDADNGLLFRMVLRQVAPEMELTIVNTGTELMDLLSKQVPDLLFLDLNMPGKNGIDCLVEIRQQLHLIDLPVVVYSSSCHMTDIQKSYLYKA